jgi:exosortase C (VPDSG-CTERM-specific)
LTRDSHPDSGTPPSPLLYSKPAASARRLPGFGLATLVLVLCFAKPLWDLIWFAAASELYSYILLIPFISAYLVWLRKGSLPVGPQRASKIAAVFLAAGAGVLLAYWLVLRPHLKRLEDDCLAVMMISFLLSFIGICGLYWGRETLRAVVFPLSFLAFMVPIPTVGINGIDSFLQIGSAMVARAFFTLAGTPFLQDGLVFQLPGIRIQIAPECSGIHSSLVLLITSVLAGYIFLRSPWKRGVFVFAVLPLGIVRNGFRVFTIGELCVHIGPQMIDSPIHHKGGPIFFVLSLIPLFILLIMLQRSERAGRTSGIKTRENSNPQPAD